MMQDIQAILNIITTSLGIVASVLTIYKTTIELKGKKKPSKKNRKNRPSKRKKR